MSDCGHCWGYWTRKWWTTAKLLLNTSSSSRTFRKFILQSLSFLRGIVERICISECILCSHRVGVNKATKLSQEVLSLSFALIHYFYFGVPYWRASGASETLVGNWRYVVCVFI